ncbi:MAG: HNH endonuclease [Solirubrobacteraceae bacterium]
MLVIGATVVATSTRDPADPESGTAADPPSSPPHPPNPRAIAANSDREARTSAPISGPPRLGPERPYCNRIAIANFPPEAVSSAAPGCGADQDARPLVSIKEVPVPPGRLRAMCPGWSYHCSRRRIWLTTRSGRCWTRSLLAFTTARLSSMASRRFGASARVALFLAARGRCARCGVALTPGWHADHAEPVRLGGATRPANGQALCPRCNLVKGARPA